MKVIDPGHVYALQQLDGFNSEDKLVFVKREGEGYPGNVGHHGGTIIQDVLRSCIDRLNYVNHQIPSWKNRVARWGLRLGIFMLEWRAARRHGRWLKVFRPDIENVKVCNGCGHVGCPGCDRGYE